MGIFAKYAYKNGVTISTLLSYRFLIAACLFWLTVLLTKQWSRLTTKEMITLMGMGVGGYAVMGTLLFTSFYYISPSLSEILFYSYPAMVCILLRFTSREPITTGKVTVLIFSFIGILLVMGSSSVKSNLLGELLAFGSALVYSIFIVISNRLVKHIPPLICSSYITTSAGISLLLLGLVKGDIHFISGTISWLTLLGVTVFSTYIAIQFFFEGVKRIGSSRAAILSTFEPIVTLFASFLLLHDRLSGKQWLGVSIIVASLLLMEIKQIIPLWTYIRRKVESH